MSIRSYIVFLVLPVCMSGQLRAETFYIRADGTASTKEESVSCASQSTAMNLDGYYSNSFSAGDTIVFCGEGGVYRSTLYVNQGGSNEAPMTLLGAGAVFSGADIVTGWAVSDEDIFSAPFAAEPEQVFVDGVFGDRKNSLEELTNDNDWFWDSGALHFYSEAGNPDEVFSSPGVEASARLACIVFGSQDHLVIDGFITKHTSLVGISARNPGAHVTVRNILAEWNWHIGISIGADQPSGPITVENNIARYNGTGGIAFLGPVQNSAIRRNYCYRNGKFQSENEVFEGQHLWTFGIKLWEYPPLQEGFQQGNEIYSNQCYDNGRDYDDYQGMGVGIWLDGLPGTPDNLNVVRHNLVHDNRGNGIFIEVSANTLIQANVLFNNATNPMGIVEFTPASIAIDTRESFVSENILVYNNTSVGGRCGIKLTSYDCNGCSVENNAVKNNIFVGASEHNLFALFGGDNDGEKGSGNIYVNNNFGEEQTGFIRWGWSEYGTYPAWEAAYGLPAHSVTGNPRLAAMSPTSLYLMPDSPCRDSGTTLGPDFDENLMERSTWPESVLTCDQDLYDHNWEVGAFCFTGELNGRPIFVNGFETGDLSLWTGEPGTQ